MTFALLGPIEHAFRWLLERFHYDVGLSWAWSIIALTVVVRIAMLPVTVKQMQSSRKLQMHAPQLKAIQQKYKNDKQRMQQEVMKFYQETGVNPLASCLPLLLQIPVFISLFYVLRHLSDDIKNGAPGVSGGVSFLFGAFDNITETISQQAPASYVMVVIYVVSQLASTELMATPQMDKTQRNIFRALPFIFLPFIWAFPVGLLLYWTTSNLWTLGQQAVLRKLMPRPATAELAAAGGAAGGGGSAGQALPKRTPPKRGGGQQPAAQDGASTGAAAPTAAARGGVPPKRARRPAGQTRGKRAS